MMLEQILAEGAPDHWSRYALCQSEDPGMFFPSQIANEYTKYTRAAEAKEVCARCPVSSECLDYALETSQPFGIWGGLTEKERRRERERRRSARRAARMSLEELDARAVKRRERWARTGT